VVSDVNNTRTLFDKHLNLIRHIAQGLCVTGALVLLLSRQVAVNLDAQNVEFFGHGVWFHEVGLILLALASPLAVLASLSIVFGRGFCGWCCPQTLLCELATAAQRLIAGCRSHGALTLVAVVAGVVSIALIIAVGGGLALVSVLVPVETITSVAAGEYRTSLLKAIIVASLLILVNVVLLRHGFCEWICVLGWWQRLFNTSASLRVAFVTGRAKECLRCDECQTSCFMGIDPRRRKLPKTCLNCGKCVAACAAKMASVEAETLVSYTFGQPMPAGRERVTASRGMALVKASAACGLLLTFASLLLWAAQSRDMVQMMVRQASRTPVELVNSEVHGDYVVDVYNNSATALALDLTQAGLPQNAVFISPNPVTVPAHGRARAALRFRVGVAQLHSGRNEFGVIAASAGGSQPLSSYRVVFGLPATATANPDAATRLVSGARDPS
jgi:polyferredoxin